jgi:hypothetical protein
VAPLKVWFLSQFEILDLTENSTLDKRSSLFCDIIDNEEKRYVSLATDQVTITLIISLKEVRLHLKMWRRKTQTKRAAASAIGIPWLGCLGQHKDQHRPLAYLVLAASGSITANRFLCIGPIMASTATVTAAGGFAAITARVNAP